MHRNKTTKKTKKTFWQKVQNCWPWFGVAAMLAISAAMFFDDIKVPQQEVSISIDVSHSMNICQPEKDFGEKKSFFR